MAEATARAAPAIAAPPAGRAEWRRTARTLVRNRLVLAGLAMVLGLILIAALAELIAPYDPIANNVRAALQPPSSYYTSARTASAATSSAGSSTGAA